MTSDPIAVLGAGSWGTALAVYLARQGQPVRLWGHNPEHMAMLARQRENARYLPGCALPAALSVHSRMQACVEGCRDVLVVVPSHAFLSTLQQLKQCGDDWRIAWGTKGLSPSSGEVLGQVVAQVFSAAMPAAVLSGPSFAAELVREVPTAVSIAGNDADFLTALKSRLHSDVLRVYQNDDWLGVQLCGVLKNVLAIAVGVADGLRLGANSRAALITRGLAEMSRLCVALGGDEKTVMSLAGVGDVMLTCTDDQSRNRRFGLALGRGLDTKAAFAEIGQEVEGAHNVRQVHLLAQKFSLDMPITAAVYALLQGAVTPQQMVQQLMQRRPTLEN